MTAGSINSVSNDLKYYITREYDDDFHITFNVYETETNNRMLTIKSDNGDLYFDKNDSSRVILASYEASAVYSVEDASKLFSINTVDDFSSTKKISADGTLMDSYLMGIFNAYSLTDGQKIGEIVDNPKNSVDADYKLAVLNALKKMDKSTTLQELNEKLTKTVAEPDAPDSEIEEDIDV